MEWPEPIQSVQSLAENGLSSLPERYIESPSERPSSLENSGGHHTINIPLIDLSGLDDDLRRPETIREIHDACLNWGFFQVSHHKIPVELLHRTQQVWTSFFLLPLDEKLAYANNPNTYEGFGIRVGVDRCTSLDWGDYFFLHVLPSQLRDLGKWPSLPRNCKDGLSTRVASSSDEIQLRIDPMHDDLDDQITGLHKKIKMLKTVAQEIETESKFQNEFLSRLQMILIEAQAGVKSNMRRLNQSIVQQGSSHLCHVILFAFLCFMVFYLWSKFS